MKTFQQYLTEAQSQHSVFDSIVDNWETPPFFFTPTVMKRLNVTKENVLAFHGTDLEGLAGLSKLQNKKNKQISTVSGHKQRTLEHVMGGIETRGGVLALIKGDMSANFSRDAFTGLTKGGRRTVLIGQTTEFGSYYGGSDRDALVDLQNELRNAIGRSIHKAFLPVVKEWLKRSDEISFMRGSMIEKMETLQKDIESLKSNTNKLGVVINGNSRAANVNERHPGIYLLSRLSKDPSRKSKYTDMFRRASGEFVKYYMDEMEKSVKNNEAYKELFVFGGDMNGVAFDELLISNFTIEKAVVVAEFSRMLKPVENADKMEIPDKAFIDKFGKDIDDLQKELDGTTIDPSKTGDVEQRIDRIKEINDFILKYWKDRVRSEMSGIELTFIGNQEERDSELTKLHQKVQSQDNAAMNIIYKK